MRVLNIKVKFSIPINPDRLDLNGNIYTEEAIINSLETYKNAPIIVRNSDNITPVGMIDKAFISWSEQPYVMCEGKLMFGGTDCIVSKSHKDENGITVIDEFRITGFGVTL